ncbi:MAG TPA: DUF2059 domain-containing protein [Opitutaceae bacterium]|nr:DUF2059 domain-containing protein [Opitutaceae bacterium]
MCKKFIALLFLGFCTAVYADDASHRKAASDLLDLVNGPVAIRAGINAALGPMLDSIRRQGAPEAAVQDLRAAFNDWVDKEIIWDEIKPQVADLYVREFSEEELTQIIAFYKTPVGAKALRRLPAVVAAGAKIGQDYAKTKEASLNERIMKVVAKYKPAAPSAAPASPEK